MIKEIKEYQQAENDFNSGLESIWSAIINLEQAIENESSEASQEEKHEIELVISRLRDVWKNCANIMEVTK